ncbi:MAG: 4-hydroxy-3-methylbut-2-enyl diphosphate reductase [Sedimentisphaerales bacterium]|nr:4-hydroxy-3-methylbut-2-enyl diphosphate reductase [Sedimentisphaerales bacterium]
MKVHVAEKCGFCHGVRNAIRVAEKTLLEKKVVYSLGPIIHNRDMVEQLAKSGLKTVDKIDEIPSGTVLIRSHGAAPEQIAKLRVKGLDIVDATCILVKRLQHIAAEFDREGYEVVIIGEENHPEVQAVVGCAGNVIVITDESDLKKLPDNARLGVVCQTTQSPEHFGRMLGALGRSNFSELKVINTLCKEAIKRQESAVQLGKQVDIMFVLGGLESANTRRLAEMCRKVNKHTYHLQNWEELDKNLLRGKKTAGVTAGASTPDWIIEEFVKNLTTLDGGDFPDKSIL